MLCGDVDQHLRRFTGLLLALQERWVPHSQYTGKASDQPWFGPECRAASDAKYRAWRAYKRRPTVWNRRRHSEAAQRMRTTQEWASVHWKENLRRKMRGGQVGCKRWWGLVKEQQGVTRGNTIPSLQREDGSLAHTAQDKADLLARYFAGKMCVPDPDKTPPTLPQIIKDKLETVTTSEVEVRDLLLKVDVKKAVGPDNISPCLLRQCANELARPLASLFNHCLLTSTWPKAWKTSNVCTKRVVSVRQKITALCPCCRCSVKYCWNLSWSPGLRTTWINTILYAPGSLDSGKGGQRQTCTCCWPPV